MYLNGMARDWFFKKTFQEEQLFAYKEPNYELELNSRLRSRVQGEDEPALSYCYIVISLCSKVDRGFDLLLGNDAVYQLKGHHNFSALTALM